jgi:hypothetical protein
MAAVLLSLGLCWTSSVRAQDDTISPIVSATAPANVAFDVPLKAKLAVTFSEAMDPGTMTSLSFLLERHHVGTQPIYF